jgi:hypothetical protein
MEPRFGHDFSEVRVHTDASAARSAEAVNALAYTVGQNVVFGAGRYAPLTVAGRRLLAHELMHTVQQRTTQPTGRIGAAAIEEYEGQAEDAGNQAIAEDAATPLRIRHEPRHARGNIRETSSIIQFQKTPAGGLESTATSQSAPGKSASVEQPVDDDALAEAGLLSLGQVLVKVAAPEAQTLRDMYNMGKLRIDAEKVTLMAKNVAESEIARRLAEMRFNLGMDVRKTGSALMRKGAELVDAVRGQARPTYESLRATKTDAEIIESAARTNKWVNKLPTGLKWTGGALWFISLGLSIRVVLNAPVEQKAAVAQKEIEGTIGAVGGAAAGEGLCIVLAIATEGLGLIVCGLLGGIAGSAAARKANLLEVLDMVPHNVPEMSGRIFRVEGDWKEIDLFILSIPLETVTAADNVLVVATGMVSGEEIGGRGHYHRYEVTPANNAALRLFGGKDPKYVPNYLLKKASGEDLKASKD